MGVVFVGKMFTKNLFILQNVCNFAADICKIV